MYKLFDDAVGHRRQNVECMPFSQSIKEFVEFEAECVEGRGTSWIDFGIFRLYVFRQTQQ